METLQSVSNDPPIVAAPLDRMSVGTGGRFLTKTAATPADPPTSMATSRSAPSLVTIVSAALILLLFACLFNYMLNHAVQSKEYWDRYVALYNSVQSIVAAAVGALLGAQVSAGQIVVARAEGDQAKQRVSKLEGNIKAFQADVTNIDAGVGSAPQKMTGPDERSAEAGGLVSRERLLVRAMTLLH